MKISEMALLCAAFHLSSAAAAGDRHGDAVSHEEMKIVIVEGENDAATRIELDSDKLGFDLHEMALGEQRSVVDETGRAMLITREEDGFSIDVDGKTVRLPMLHDAHHAAGDAGDVDVRVMHHPPMSPPTDGVTIISNEPVDDATQQAIRSMLVSAGHEGEVRFVDRESRPSGPHRIMKVVRKIEVDD